MKTSRSASTVSASDFTPRSGRASTTHFQVIRHGADLPPIIIVGDSIPVPLVLQRFREDVPVWHLGIDGCHVWPPEYLTLEQQVNNYLNVLKTINFTCKCLLVGFSYGGLVAYRLASALQELGWEQVELCMIEPAYPTRSLPKRRKPREYLEYPRLLTRRNISITWQRFVAGLNLAANRSNAIPEISSRWVHMYPHYLINILFADTRSVGRKIGLIGDQAYFQEFGDLWKKIEPGNIDECVLPADSGHLNWLRDQNGFKALEYIEQIYWRLRWQ